MYVIQYVCISMHVCVMRFKDFVGSFNIFLFRLSCRAPPCGIIDMSEMFRHFKTKYFFCHRCTGTCHWMAPEVFVSNSYDEKAPETAQSLPIVTGFEFRFGTPLLRWTYILML